MFELESDEDNRKIIKPKNNGIYNLDLGIAISKSLIKEPGSQILSPFTVQKEIDVKISRLIINIDSSTSEPDYF